MPVAQYGVSLSIGGVSIQKTVNRSGDGVTSHEIALPAAKEGALTTRTDDNTGVLTMDAGHLFTDGQILDVFWDGGVRYGMTIGTVATNEVPIDGGAGDNLPDDETDITASVQVPIVTNIDGDNAEIIGLLLEYTDPNADAAGHVDFQDADDNTIEAIELVGNSPVIYDLGSGISNPFTGAPITKAQASNGSSAAAATLKIICLSDSTP